jgi:hypothetical protein
MSTDCPSSLAPKKSCTIDVTFDPRQVGSINGQLMRGSSGVVSLTGVGLPPLEFSLATLDFGSVAIGTASSPKSVILTNYQDSALAISAIVASGGYSQTSDCPSSLSSGSTCTINVVFQPTAKGAIPGAITVTTDAALAAPPIGLTGTGTGSATAKVSFSPANLIFGNIEAGTSGTAQNVILTNTDSVSSLTVHSIAVSGGYSQTNNCSAPIAPNGNCTISVSFRPTANLVAVTYPGAVTVQDSDATAAQVIGLMGTSVAPVSASPASLDFGVINLGVDSLPQTVTFSNFDSASESTSLSVPSPLSATNNSCGSNLAPGTSCSADFSLSGSSARSFSGAVTYTLSSGGFLNPQVINVSGCVTSLVRTPTSLNFGGPTVGQPSDTETATLTGDSTKFSNFLITGVNASEFSISNNSCSSPLSGPCNVDLVFKPSSSGTKTATLNVVDDQSCSPQPVVLQGGSTVGPFVVTVMPRGSGSGTITSNPAGINCGSQGSTCSANFNAGTAVTLTATPDVSSNFTSWDDACSGTATCKLTMSADRQVAATFTILPSLTVSVDPMNAAGSGSVTSNPAGIDCPATSCQSYFQPGTVVALTAKPGTGSSFTGWSNGSCSGTSNCSLTMNTDQHVDAGFSGPPTLIVNVQGTGSGSVASNPPGINCLGNCSATFPSGTSVTLTATPIGPSTFSGWDNACSGVGTCKLLMTSDVTEDATFTGPPDFSVTIDPATPQSIPAGGAARFTISLNPMNNFSSTVTLACASSATAQGVNCQLSSASMQPGGGTATATITTKGPSAALTYPSGSFNRLMFAMLVPVLGLPLIAAGIGPRKCRLWIAPLLLLGIVGLSFLLPACGGGSNVPQSGTPPGTYTATISETAGSIQHNSTVTVTVH